MFLIALETVIYDVSQGSILGLPLFLIYANDLQNVSKSIKPIMFQLMQTWLDTNKLSLNVTKTKLNSIYESNENGIDIIYQECKYYDSEEFIYDAQGVYHLSQDFRLQK